MAVNLVTDCGADPSGAAASDAALTKALASSAVYVPAGRYVFDTPVTSHLADTQSLSIFGDGQDVSMFCWRQPGGLTLNYGQLSSVHMRDISLVSRIANGGTALNLIGPPAMPPPAQSEISRCYIGGENYNTNANWSTCANLTRMNSVNFDGVKFQGSPSSQGVTLQGDPNAQFQYTIQINFTDCFWNIFAGCLYYNDYVQGVSVDGCNFSNCTWGIVVPSGCQGILSQLSIVNSQFGPTLGNCISVQSPVQPIQIANTLFECDSPGTGGVILWSTAFAQIIGNTFLSQQGQAIYIGPMNGTGPASAGAAIIANNIIQNAVYGVHVCSGTRNVKIHDNTLMACAKPVFDQTGAAAQHDNMVC